MLPALKSLPYKDCLKACNISTLHYRRIRGNMIETFKILTGKHQLLLELAPALLEAMICGFRKIDLNTICVNTVFLTGLLTHGIVYPIMLCLLILLMYLRTDLISTVLA